MYFSTLKTYLSFLEKTYISSKIWGLQKTRWKYLNSMDYFTSTTYLQHRLAFVLKIRTPSLQILY